MKPNESYSYLSNTAFTPDFTSILKCYQPILGLEAFSLYHYLWSFYDHGTGRYKLSRILNQLDFGTQTLEKALDVLTAMRLLSLYRGEAGYQFVLHAPLSVPDFLDNPLYHALLTKKIGEPAVAALSSQLPLQEKNISRGFSEVFATDGTTVAFTPRTDFNIAAFKGMMRQDQLRFQEEESDVIGLYHLAERQNWTWSDAYQVAKETTIDGQLSIKRMEQQVKVTPQQTGSRTVQEEALLRESKASQPILFLGKLKKVRQAVILASERTCLQEMAQMGLLDEVINIIVFYAFQKTGSANLNEKYALKIANDLSYKEIRTAEAAIDVLREGKKKATTPVPQKENVPEWSKKEVKTEKTAEDEARLAALRQKMLAREEQGGE